MEPARKRLLDREILQGTTKYRLTLDREDWPGIYPGMARYVLAAEEAGKVRAVFRTNTFEYPPAGPGRAGKVACDMAARWEKELASDPAGLFSSYAPEPVPPEAPGPEVIVIQGSPRPDGNCSILAGWAVEAARHAGRSARVIYPHDMEIHPCIGCYQCYNTGSCVFADDMREITAAIRSARLLVICSPVYTNTVPGRLKTLIDRMQAYNAELALAGGGRERKGILLSVAGRQGKENFLCTTRVINAFFRNTGTEPAGQVLSDGMDHIRDIRTIPGRMDEVQRLVAACLER